MSASIPPVLLSKQSSHQQHLGQCRITQFKALTRSLGRAPLRSAFSFATMPARLGATWRDWLNLLDALEADLQELDCNEKNWKKAQAKIKGVITCSVVAAVCGVA
ncbi:hypothetical protein BC937DRAFT_90301 [Endogone sp. FLAS-F59071]|nr:hypothetical protein BC937DRAFT_90301 [Endogone sp. FLAS-F59071]|eukprot:RUS17179.1 hypothetical protein BC937DRAFT_90301 [Endogone sp. FLAS-F59071]